MSTGKANIAIIGAGVGAMTAGARLAKAGHTVNFFEASNRAGGKCETIEREGFRFDTGPTLLTLPAVYRDLFLKTGKRLELIAKVEGVDPAFQYNFADGKQITFPNLSLNKTVEEISRVLGVEAGLQWRALMDRAEKMWEISRTPFVESELASLSKLIATPGFLKDMGVIAPWKSLRKLRSQYSNSPHIGAIIDRYATYSGSDPRKVPAVLLTIAFIECTFGAWHIDGGIGKLSQLLEERNRELGAEFHFNTRVQEIIVENDKAAGIKLESGEFVNADYVISGSDAENTYHHLISPSNKKTRSERFKLKKATPSFSGFSLYLGLNNKNYEGTPPQLAHHTIYFPENYDAEFDDLFVARRPVDDPTIYICAPGAEMIVDPAQKDYKEAWSVLINAPLHLPDSGLDWNKSKDEYGRKIIKKLDALGLQVSERLEYFEFRSPADIEAQFNSPGGSIYGTSSNGARSAFLRAKNRSPIEKLYCVGGSAHPGGGLPLVGISGEIVSEMILKDMTNI